MAEFCSICSSLIIDGSCSNKNCNRSDKASKKKKTSSRKKQTRE